MSERISMSVVRRLPRYYRFLDELDKGGYVRISSRELAERMGLTASQIRQDLNCFGGFGQQGYGYNIRYLHGKISELLGVTGGFKAVIVGAGNLGHALATTHMFERRGVRRLALFDVKEDVVNTEIAGIPVYHTDTLGEFCKREGIDIGVLTVPKEAAYDVAKTMVDSGVTGIWNFANMELQMDEPGVTVENIHLGDSLLTLCYEIKLEKDRKREKDGGEE